MLEYFNLFVHHLLKFGEFRITAFEPNPCRALVTAFGALFSAPCVMIPELVAWAKRHPGHLVVDDTTNPKYGLKQWCKKLKIPGTGGYVYGFKIVLFLWECPEGRYPIGFALWHKHSLSLTELALEGFSQLRNHFDVKPACTLADGGYSSDTILKRLDDYGWAYIIRFRKDRLLDGVPIRHHIPRGYGETTGHIKNGTKLKVVRRQKHFIASNRLSWESQTIRSLYAIRWKVEEVFRALKTCIGLNGCHQHSMGAQAVYVTMCLLLFSCLEFVSGGSPYKLWRSVNSGECYLDILVHNSITALF